MIINSFFTKQGISATGLTPVVNVWAINDTDGVKVPVATGLPAVDAGDGVYTLDISAYINNQTHYFVVVDAGDSMTPYGRYNTGSITPIRSVADDVWNANAISYTNANSMGELINKISAHTSTTAVDIIDIKQLLYTIKQFENNRTKIDTQTNTLTVYKDDGVTPLQIFNLKDSVGNGSVTEVAERVPTL